VCCLVLFFCFVQEFCFELRCGVFGFCVFLIFGGFVFFVEVYLRVFFCLWVG